MATVLKALAVAAVFGSAATIAHAAPSNMSPMADGARGNLVLVHGNHRSCERGRGGWHRHNRFGERRSCRRWDGRGQRPDTCVRVGPIWYCDY